MQSESEIKQKIIDYLSSHMKVTLATVTPEGKPLAHTVVYVNEAATVYFRSRDSRRKYQNILKNPSIAYTVDEYPGDDWRQLHGVQMEGTAKVVTAQTDIEHIHDLFVKKYPFVEDFIPRTRPGLTIIKIEPREGFWLDYRIEWGHRDNVTF